MRRQIFISHSGRDREIVDAILESFKGTGVRPLLMEDAQDEVSKDGEANWRWIRKQIMRSEALFVILSKGLIAREHTQNWVAFEIGVAAGCDPPKPVFVMRGQRVRFPVPYLNHYFPYSVTNRPPRFDGRMETLWRGNVDRLMKKYIEDPLQAPASCRVHCQSCRTDFFLHGKKRIGRCPCCNSRPARQEAW